MPTKLKVLMGMFAVSGLINAVTGHWLFLAYAVLVCLGIASGHDGLRTLFRLAAGAGTLFYVGVAVLTILAGLGGGFGLAQFAVVMAFATFGALSGGFSYWCLGEQDVQRWMYVRSMGEAA